MKTRFHLFAFAVLLLLIKVCPALSQDISFNKVTLPDETFQGLISGITQDPEGNIWFSSGLSGLSRFDGVHLKTMVQVLKNLIPAQTALYITNTMKVNKELLVEMKGEMNKGNIDDANAIANDVIDNEEKINHHGKRADAIVKDMLQHSPTNTGQREPANINKLADEYLRLSYHGLKAKDKDFNSTMKTDFDQSIGNINIIPQDIGRVLVNLFNNAFYATNEKRKNLSGLKDLTGLEKYNPLVSVQTKKVNNKVEIIVSDNGNGTPSSIKEKIFQPFFTTKPTGQGTGLGLSLSYDIIKAHGGKIKVETKDGEARPDDPVGRGSEFIVQLPLTKTS